MPQRLAIPQHRMLIPLAAFLAILPLLFHGASCGHDFDFHLLNWLEARQQLAHLTWPRWAYTPAYGAGEPRFLFYPPLSWLIGAALTAFLPFPLVATAYTWMCLTLAGLSLRRLAAPYASPAAATLAAIFYLANPYMLFTAYERTAYAELLAAAILPLLFAAILSPQLRIAPIALPLALLWLTNAPAAVMGTYALALLAVVRVARGPVLREAGVIASATMLGLGAAAFYIVPAAYERRWVSINLVVVTGLRPVDNFLFHHTPDADHDAVLHTASLIAILLLGLTLAVLVLAWRARPKNAILAPISLLAIVITFLLVPLSAPVWAHLPDLAFLQFPWRLLALLTPLLALALTQVSQAGASKLNSPTVLGPATLFLLAVLISPAWYSFNQLCDLEDTPAGRQQAYHSYAGTEPTDEYTPLHANPDALKPGDPPYWLAENPGAAAPPNLRPGQAPNHLALAVPTPEYLILNRRDYPAWRIRLNGHPAAQLPAERDDGLIALAVPAGSDTIDLSLAETPDETAGLTLSFLSIATLGLLRLRTIRYTHMDRSMHSL